MHPVWFTDWIQGDINMHPVWFTDWIQGEDMYLVWFTAWIQGEEGQIAPPLYLLTVILNYNNLCFFLKTYFNISAKRIANLQKPKYLLRNLVIKEKMCKRKIAQIATNYTF